MHHHKTGNQQPSVPSQTRNWGRIINSLKAALRAALRSSLILVCSASALSADTLQTSNPFLPPGYGEEEKAPPPPPPKVNGPISRQLEFRGFVQLDGVLEYSLFDKSEQIGYWLEENQSKNGIQVRGFDHGSKTLTVTMNGRTEQLTLSSPSDTPLNVATSVNPAGGNRKQPPTLPPSLQNANKRTSNAGENRRRVVPRRRVVLPQN